MPASTGEAPVESGRARYYEFGQNVACSFPGLPLDGFYASVSTAEYGQADLCGTFLDIQGPHGHVRAEIVDRCPGCGQGQFDLSPAAFEQLADLSTGVIDIRFSRVRDANPVPHALSFVVKRGSSSDWLGLLVNETGNPLEQVALRPVAGGPWRPLTRGIDNYWVLSKPGAGPFVALVTDDEGGRAQGSGIALLPGQVQRTDTRIFPVPGANGAVRPAAAEPSVGRCEGHAS